jgi:hypothetical protein
MGDVMNASTLLLFAPLVIASGCSLALDSERHQCEEAADCAAIFSAPESAYRCVNNLCLTYRECTDNTGCAAVPGKPYCANEKCVACTEKAQCVNANTSTAMDCVSNVCKDEVWGCLGEMDDRPAATQPTATINAMAKDPLADQTKPNPYPAGLSAVLCKAPTVDPACLEPLTGTTSKYDMSTGVLTLGNVVNDTANLHLRFSGSGQSYLPVEYYTNRSARDTMTVDDVNFVPAGVFGTIMNGNIKVDASKASINVRIHDCKGAMAPNVSLTSSVTPPDLLHSYVDGKAPRFDLEETTAAGVAGIFNATPGTNTTLTLSIKAFTPARTITYQIAPIGNAISVIDLYPRK